MAHRIQQSRRHILYGRAFVLLALISGCAAFPQRGHTMERTELYFGLTRPNGPDVMEIEFQTFLDDVVTPRFPQGYTVLSGQGHWREQQGKARTESSHVLVILHADTSEDDRKIEEIRAAYVTRFAQEAVMRADAFENISF